MNDNAPLISVLVPAYNAEETISYAVASLLSQTYENWECVVVDDGSTDNTLRLLRMFERFDSRIKVFSFGENRGRGAARIKTLYEASGKYITMLDADDWLYPHKLETQVCFLEKNPDVTLHSMGMAIVEGAHLIAKRGVSVDVHQSFDSLSRIFIPHAPSMIRLADIGENTYDYRFKLAQDQDFIRRVLVGRKYVVSSGVAYTYSEIGSVSVSKVLRGYFYNALGYLKLRKDFGWASYLAALKELLKIPYITIKFSVKGRKAVLGGRSGSIGSLDQQEFLDAKSKIDHVYQDLIKKGGVS